MSDNVFDDVLAANAQHAQSFERPAMEGVAAKGIALLTCMDSRIDPLAMLGLSRLPAERAYQQCAEQPDVSKCHDPLTSWLP